jgi:putative endonuclease
MNEFVTYILVSESNPGKIYIGYTSDLINRIASHNHFATKGHTLRFRPWRVEQLWFYTTKSEALSQEKFLKSGVGRKLIREELRL